MLEVDKGGEKDSLVQITGCKCFSLCWRRAVQLRDRSGAVKERPHAVHDENHRPYLI